MSDVTLSSKPLPLPPSDTDLVRCLRPDAGVPDRKDQPVRLDFLAPAVEPDEIGRLAHYRIFKVIGQGGMGVVFRAEDVHLQRLVALKVLRPDAPAELDGHYRLLRKARAAATIKSDHVVTIYQVGTDRDVPFLAMELLEGESLDQWLERDRKPTVSEVLRLGREIALGLAAAHQKGLIHRDVKPSNIWLEAGTARVKLLDFGLVRNDAHNIQLTHQGLAVGTPAYMAPEQARGVGVDARCDLFGLGVVLYRLCTGTAPFRGETTMALLTALAVDAARPVRELNPDLPAALATLIEELLAKAPENRPASAQVVADRLQAIARGTDTVADRTGPTPLGPSLPDRLSKHSHTEICVLPAVPPVRRGAGVPLRRLAVVAALLLICGVLGGGAGVVLFAGDDRATQTAVPTVPLSDPGTGDVATSKKVVGGDDDWVERVSALANPGDQVRAVSDRLRQRNPGFDGQVTPTIDAIGVTGLEFSTDNVSDLSPVRAVRTLRFLTCVGSERGKGQVADLTPLRGLPLERLTLDRNKLSDLSPLKGMKLTHLRLQSCGPLRDLTPLRGLPLTHLDVYVCPLVADLTALRGMKLVHLDAGGTAISDLSPLEGMPLATLNLFGCTAVTDVTPLRDTRLTSLNISYCRQLPDLTPLQKLPLNELRIEGCDRVKDVAPLKDLKLKSFVFDPRIVGEGVSVLRDMTTLTAIDVQDPPRFTAAEFWKKLDAGDFR